MEKLILLVKDRWFIIIFALTLAIPLYGWILDANIELSGVLASSEKVIASYESVGDGTFQSYINDLWENNFPGKKALLKVRNQILYSIFNVSPNTNVVIGKDKYLFEPNYILFETQAYAPSTEEYFEDLGNDLDELNNILESYGKELYVYITPSKAHFCYDRISNQYQFMDKENEYSYTNYSKLLDTLNQNSIKYYDSVQFITENPCALTAPIFYATGIHWSKPWSELNAANLVEYINSKSQYDLGHVIVDEYECDEPVDHATDLYSSLNLMVKPDDDWWDANISIADEGEDKPNVFFRGGSFMGEGGVSGIINTVLGKDSVHFENSYYFLRNYSEYYTLSSFTAYDELNLDELLGKSDILVLEVNEAAIYTMSWGFIDYLLEHPDYIDRETNATGNTISTVFGGNTVEVVGSVNTTENPWGYTAGVITTDEGECILLNPNTSATWFCSENMRLFAKIHPWVADCSDGAGLRIWILDDADNILLDYVMQIDNDSDWCEIAINTSELDCAAKIKVMANNGGNNDDNCDWVIISSS